MSLSTRGSLAKVQQGINSIKTKIVLVVFAHRADKVPHNGCCPYCCARRIHPFGKLYQAKTYPLWSDSDAYAYKHPPACILFRIASSGTALNIYTFKNIES
jgi:hypothetical protein